MVEKTIGIDTIFFWIVFLVFVALVVWWAFGNSPTIELLSLGVTALAAVLTWRGIRRSNRSEKTHRTQTQMLKAILERLK